MQCQYLEDFDRYKRCVAKSGIQTPTIHELRKYCFVSPYNCPVYQAYIEKRVEKEEEREANQRQQAKSNINPGTII